jgi:hypothetical protein
MARFELDLRLDAPGAGGLADALTEESQRVRERIYRELGLKAHSKAWVRIDPRAGSALQRLREACASGKAVAGAGRLTELLSPEETEAADWFLLVTPTADDSFSLWDDYPAYKPGSLPRAHALNHTFVSQAFVEACERRKLHGISFLRCRNAGRKAGAAWFAALPGHSLGRGLDHPWFDRRAWIGDVGAHPAKRSSPLEVGQNCFHQRWLRPDLRPDETLKPVLELFSRPAADDSGLSGLSFVTVPRYWAGALPEADFAYVPWGEDGPNREGKILRFRQLMVGREARRALIESGLVAAKSLLAVRSVAAPEPGVEVLDGRYPAVAPMYTPNELDALRATEKRVFGP